jgi:superkiller protein 3
LTLIAPSSPFVYYTLGTYYARTADTIRAQFAFQRAYQLDTLFLSAYEHAAALTRREERAKRTIEVLTLALDKGNDDWCVHVELGSAFLAENDPARAAAQFERALLLNPRSYTGNIRAGMAQQALKNFAKAREYYNTAIGIDPTLQEAVERLSKLNEVQKSAK